VALAKSVLTAALSAGVLTLGACQAPADDLASDYREGIGQNYISGDGAYVFLEPESRGEEITFTGDLDIGGGWASKEYLGQPILVNFWYAGCPPCRLEAADLQALNEQFAPEGVVLIGVNILDQRPTALTFADEFGITYPSILDAESGLARLAFAGDITPNAVPTTLVLDRDHRIAARVSGLISDVDLLTRMIDDVVNEGEPSGAESGQ
jgi:thiol-disulfide isomerase/thioredoxin